MTMETIREYYACKTEKRFKQFKLRVIKRARVHMKTEIQSRKMKEKTIQNFGHTVKRNSQCGA